MLPETQEGRALYVSSREFRNRMREIDLRRVGGDLDAFARGQREYLISDLDMEFIREQSDFMKSEGQLTSEAQEALDSLFGWAEELKRRLA